MAPTITQKPSATTPTAPENGGTLPGADPSQINGMGPTQEQLQQVLEEFNKIDEEIQLKSLSAALSGKDVMLEMTVTSGGSATPLTVPLTEQQLQELNESTPAEQAAYLYTNIQGLLSSQPQTPVPQPTPGSNPGLSEPVEIAGVAVKVELNTDTGQPFADLNDQNQQYIATLVNSINERLPENVTLNGINIGLNDTTFIFDSPTSDPSQVRLDQSLTTGAINLDTLVQKVNEQFPSSEQPEPGIPNSPTPPPPPPPAAPTEPATSPQQARAQGLLTQLTRTLPNLDEATVRTLNAKLEKYPDSLAEFCQIALQAAQEGRKNAAELTSLVDAHAGDKNYENFRIACGL